jgi:hypothetical protein
MEKIKRVSYVVTRWFGGLCDSLLLFFSRCTNQENDFSFSLPLQCRGIILPLKMWTREMYAVIDVLSIFLIKVYMHDNPTCRGHIRKQEVEEDLAMGSEAPSWHNVRPSKD